jgi:hypothetical protein
VDFDALKEETISKLREVQGSLVAWTEEEIEESINNGFSEISDATEWFERFQDIDLLDRLPYYDLRTAADYPVLGIGPAFNYYTNRWLIPITSRDLDRSDLRWEERIAEPEYILVRSLWHLGYWPRKQTTTGTIKQYYKSMPDPLSSGSDIPGFPEAYHYGLVQFALWELFGMDGETDLAVGAWKEYLSYEQGLRSYVEGRASVPRVRGHQNG